MNFYMKTQRKYTMEHFLDTYNANTHFYFHMSTGSKLIQTDGYRNQTMDEQKYYYVVQSL